MTDIFELKDVNFRHHPGLPNVLEHFDFSVGGGERVAVLGANGAGKTTLFNTLAGVYKPQDGEVLYRGEPIEYTKEGLTAVRSDIAVVLQNPDEQMFCSLVEEDVAFGPMNLGVDREEIEIRIDKALREVRMSDYRNRPLQQLSGGQRKRVAIAGALVCNPKVMIMDEPTAGLDPQASAEVMELAEKLHLNGVTVIISTHDVDLAYGWAESVCAICNGHSIFRGTPEDFYNRTSDVNRCGLIPPSVFCMNKEISQITGTPEDPYPRNLCSFLAKFGKGNHTPGRLFCVPCNDQDVSGLYRTAIEGIGPDAKIGVCGPDARSGLSDKRIDFYFNGMESCFTEVVLGRDSILFYDRVFDKSIKEQLRILEQFGTEIITEEVH